MLESILGIEPLPLRRRAVLAEQFGLYVSFESRIPSCRSASHKFCGYGVLLFAISLGMMILFSYSDMCATTVNSVHGISQRIVPICQFNSFYILRQLKTCRETHNTNNQSHDHPSPNKTGLSPKQPSATRLSETPTRRSHTIELYQDILSVLSFLDNLPFDSTTKAAASGTALPSVARLQSWLL